eukprot:tig00000615_g2572.t1
MFYSTHVLTKKGPLAKIWLAAHFDKNKLTKLQILQTSIPDTCESIANPAVPMALRMSGPLLLGVSRIYASKVRFLETDCNEALAKLKTAVVARAGQVDLPADGAIAHVAAITLPDNLEDVDVHNLTIQFVPAGEAHTSSRDAITLKEKSTGMVDLQLGEGDFFDIGDERSAGWLFNDVLDPVVEEPERGRKAAPKEARASEADRVETPEIGRSAPVQNKDDIPAPEFVADFEPFGDDMDIGAMLDNAAAGKAAAAPERASELAPMALEPMGMPTPLADDAPRESNRASTKLSALSPVQIEPFPTPLVPVSMKRGGKRRKVGPIISEETELSSEHIRQAISDTTDIVFTKDDMRSRLGLARADAEAAAAPAVEPLSLEALIASDRPLLAGLEADFLSGLRKRAKEEAAGGPKKRSKAKRETKEGAADAQAPAPADEPDEPRRSSDAVVAAGEDQHWDAPDAPFFDGGFDGAGPAGELGAPADEEKAPSPAPREADAEAGPAERKKKGKERAGRTVEAGGDLEEDLEAPGQQEAAHAFSARTVKMMNLIKKALADEEDDEAHLSLADMTRGKKKKTAAGAFFELLVLSTRGYIRVEQEEPYGDILVRRTEKLFNAPSSQLVASQG